MMLRVIANPEPCTGCLNCLMVCAQHRTGEAKPGSAGIRIQLNPFTGIHEIRVCRQCDTAQCAEACPVNAISRNEKNGIWTINRTRCIHCGACVQACPFHAMFWNDADDEPVKCDMCNGDPQCIRACHFGVLHLAESNRQITMGIPTDDLDPKLGRE